MIEKIYVTPFISSKSFVWLNALSLHCPDYCHCFLDPSSHWTRQYIYPHGLGTNENTAFLMRKLPLYTKFVTPSTRWPIVMRKCTQHEVWPTWPWPTDCITPQAPLQSGPSFICFQVKMLLFQSARPTPATQLWILELTCIKFSAFWTICSLKMEHLSLQKPCNNGLIVKVFDGLPHSPPSTGIWYCWALEWPPQKGTQKDFRLCLSHLLLLHTCSLVRQFNPWIWFSPERNHLLSAAPWVMIRTKGVRSYMDIFWQFGILSRC